MCHENSVGLTFNVIYFTSDISAFTSHILCQVLSAHVGALLENVAVSSVSFAFLAAGILNLKSLTIFWLNVSNNKPADLRPDLSKQKMCILGRPLENLEGYDLSVVTFGDFLKVFFLISYEK